MKLGKQLTDLKKDLEELEKEAIRAEGRLDQAYEALTAEGFKDEVEAKKEADRLEEQLKQDEKEAEDLIAACKEKYSDFIEFTGE